MSGRPCVCRFVTATPSRHEPAPWAIRETLYGRWTTLPGRRRAAVAAGALLAVTGLVGGVALLAASVLSAGPGSGSAAAHGTDTEIRDAPKPSLILPTAVEEREPTISTTSSPRPSKKPARRTPSPSARPTGKPGEPGVTFTAWAGPGCNTPAGGGYRETGRWSGGAEGWYTVASGGYDGASCDGSFTAVPMSGSPTEDHDARVEWWWSVGSASRQCSIGVYVPSGTGAGDVGGSPTLYEVRSGSGDGASAYGGFALDQRGNRGRLVDAGTYPVRDGRIAVTMFDRGVDWNDDGPTYAHHAAAQMKVTCRAS
ncbi:adhesin [Streptomyces sp. NPDC047108]|uniref:adhesin n=1 Tax=Streptomyces sp. NPDC047108 TaxID=3155025 RepID=UPI00340DF662